MIEFLTKKAKNARWTRWMWAVLIVCGLFFLLLLASHLKVKRNDLDTALWFKRLDLKNVKERQRLAESETKLEQLVVEETKILKAIDKIKNAQKTNEDVLMSVTKKIEIAETWDELEDA